MNKPGLKALVGARPLLLGLTVFAAGSTVALAQTTSGSNTVAPHFAAYEHGTYAGYGPRDSRHMIFGAVASFQPYRLLLSHSNGPAVRVDLTNDTVIHPVGASLSHGEHVAVMGYWSKGTFIANRVMLG